LPITGPARGLSVCALALSVLVGAAGWLLVPKAEVVLTALAFYVVASALAIAHCLTWHDHPKVGPGNVVTQLRLALIAAISVCVAGPSGHPYLLLSLALLALALDGVDGWLARRAGTASDFGARFDMEVDAGFAAVLSLILLTSGTAGPVILLLGFMRYGYLLVARVLPVLRRPLPERFRRKLICVVQIATLIVLMIPGLPASVALMLTLAAVLLLAWSFLVDILWQIRATA
jgi:phosphatidylglycerophosphate synthase